MAISFGNYLAQLPRSNLFPQQQQPMMTRGTNMPQYQPQPSPFQPLPYRPPGMFGSPQGGGGLGFMPLPARPPQQQVAPGGWKQSPQGGGGMLGGGSALGPFQNPQMLAQMQQVARLRAMQGGMPQFAAGGWMGGNYVA